METPHRFCGRRPRPYHLRVVGPSMSGKTAFLRYLQHGQHIETEPTNDMEVSRVYLRGAPCFAWDSRKFGPDDMKSAMLTTPNILEDLQPKSLSAAHHPMDALIYVVDASDPGRLKIASRDFERVLKTYHRVPVVLVLGTKIDLPSTVSEDFIKGQLRLLETAYDRECCVALISNVTGEGVDRALEWLYSRIWQTQGLCASIAQHLACADVQDGGLRFTLPTFPGWDPFTCCRYSRLAL